MYRLLLLAIVLPFVGKTDFGRAASEQVNVDIVAVDLAGRQTNLTQNPGVDAAPSVSHDGRIVFVSTRDGRSDLYVMDGDGRNVRRLTMSPVGDGYVSWSPLQEGVSQASWSPRGQSIAFDAEFWAGGPHCMRLCVNWKVFVVDAADGAVKRIAVQARAPAWSPDGSRLAYLSGVDPDGVASGVTVERADGSTSADFSGVVLRNDVGVVTMRRGPAWSPNGKELAFQARGRLGEPPEWIYVVRANGSKKRRLAVGRNPTWSPDGRRLAFITNYRLVTIGENGKGRRRISRNGRLVLGAAWSPKGNTLAVVTASALARADPGVPRGLRLETVSSDGKRVRVVVPRPTGSNIWSAPVWTPNGKRILVAVG